jgi:AcrR family transcriptional regulator
MIKSESESRRVKITKRMLKDALMELAEQKPLASISVTELCALADVNRSTFYSYYADVLELMDEIRGDILDQIPTPGDVKVLSEDDAELQDNFTAFFSYVHEHARDFSVLFRSGGMGFTDQLTSAILERFHGPAEQDRSSGLTVRWGYIFAVNGVIGVMRDWIESGFPMSDEQFAHVVLKMSFHANDFLG